MKSKIDGIIYFDISRKEFDFSASFIKRWFDDEGGQWNGYIFVAEHSIEIDMPDDFDLIGPQLAALDVKEAELNLQYNQAIKQIKCERNSLLAIEG